MDDPGRPFFVPRERTSRCRFNVKAFDWQAVWGPKKMTIYNKANALVVDAEAGSIELACIVTPAAAVEAKWPRATVLAASWSSNRDMTQPGAAVAVPPTVPQVLLKEQLQFLELRWVHAEAQSRPRKHEAEKTFARQGQRGGQSRRQVFPAEVENNVGRQLQEERRRLRQWRGLGVCGRRQWQRKWRCEW